MQPPLLIVGASARAAAFSGCRAGFFVSTIDLFADADLQARCQAEVFANYPRSLIRQARSCAPSPWMYTGGLENHPAVVDRLARERPLLGNLGRVLRAVRDPTALRHFLSQAGFDMPEVATSPAGLPRDGSWLVKPLRSSGGHGIEPWLGQALSTERHSYWQARVEGASHAALYLATHDGAELIGITQQWVGARCCHAAPFHYCGSIGPVRLAESTEQQLRRLGTALVEHFGMRGLFGVDLVVRGEQAFAIEINPRYPASAEVLERALGLSLVAEHARACGEELPSNPSDLSPRAELPISGKCILFAERALEVTQRFQELLGSHNAHACDALAPLVADIPSIGCHIADGWPVVTLLADGRSHDEVQRELTQRAAELFDLMAIL